MNQTPEQIARDAIDKQLTACGWIIRNKNEINLSTGTGVAVREYGTDIGPADYVLFADKKPVGITEAKRAEEGTRLTTFGYFNKNIVSDYGYEKAVIDGVLVPYNVFTIKTKITKNGAAIAMGENVDKRERLTRRKFWEAVDDLYKIV